MRLLLINPNTSPEITDRVLAAARPLAPPGAELVGATGRFGARYIAGRAAAAIAAHAALDAWAEHGSGCDAVLFACFGGDGLDALKELAPVPVVGMAQAACHAACLLGRRFAIVTGGERWKPMLEELVAASGLADRLAAIRTVAPTGAEIARDPEAARASLAAACRGCVAEDGADVVILGGGGLAGMADALADAVPVPVLCSVAAGVRAVVSVAQSAAPKPRAGTYALPEPVDTIGLSPALARAMRGGSP
jgi:Asp/Glu/hydantoin racemase